MNEDSDSPAAGVQSMGENERAKSRAKPPRTRPYRKWMPAPGSRVHRGLHHAHRALLWTTVTIIGLATIIIVASFFVDEPLRKKIEAGMNQQLRGYQVTLPHAHFQLFSLAVTLRDLQIRQDSHPDPAVMLLPRLRASVQWSALIHRRLVADFQFDNPNLYLNLPQLQSEIHNEVRIRDEGWQQAFQAIYPLKINLVTITDGTVTYLDNDPTHPLRLTHVQLTAGNIRNVKSDSGQFPSPVHVEAVVFGSGRAMLDGNADFLLKPNVGVLAKFQVADIPLDEMSPIAARASFVTHGGILSGFGETEYTPGARYTHFNDVTVRGIRVDYVQGGTPASRTSGTSLAPHPAQTPAGPRTELTIDRMELVDGTIGTINRSRRPNYRLFLTNARLTLSHWSNRPGDPPASATLHGRFMGVGAADGSGTFQFGSKSQNFSVKLAIADTPLPAMNDVFRAYGNFDVARGTFSLYSEMTAKDQVINGYMKPLFRDVKVYDHEQDKNKNEFRKLYERIVGIAAKTLENRKRDEVVTVANLHGRVENPSTSFWQVFGKMLENAFIKAILPGFLRHANAETSGAAGDGTNGGGTG